MSDDHGDAVRDDVYSKAVRAGKRTYFFDVKSTRGNDLYLTITESKKRFDQDGSHSYEKHKLFLYKEDFEKFADGLHEAIAHIQTLRNEDETYSQPNQDEKGSEDSHSFSDVSFEDLDRD